MTDIMTDVLKIIANEKNQENEKSFSHNLWLMSGVEKIIYNFYFPMRPIVAYGALLQVDTRYK